MRRVIHTDASPPDTTLDGTTVRQHLLPEEHRGNQFAATGHGDFGQDEQLHGAPPPDSQRIVRPSPNACQRRVPLNAPCQEARQEVSPWVSASRSPKISRHAMQRSPTSVQVILELGTLCSHSASPKSRPASSLPKA